MDINELQVPLVSAISFAFFTWKVYYSVQSRLNSVSEKISSLEEVNKVQDSRTQSEISVLDKAQQLVERKWENRLELLELAFKNHVQSSGKESYAIAAKLRKIRQFW